jgi:prepilin-type N-terminal cleavage/methylation domain-containing protein
MSTAPRKSESEVNIPGFPAGDGYSLLETMTVIVVILTLASIATPAFRWLAQTPDVWSLRSRRDSARDKI